MRGRPCQRLARHTRLAVAGPLALAAFIAALPSRAEAPPAVSPEVDQAVRTAPPASVGKRPKTSRFELGARVGYSFGFGEVYSGLTMSDATNGAFPVFVDFGWRAIPSLYVGVFGQFAPVLLRTNPKTCPPEFSCAAENWRVGIEVDYHFLPRTKLDPYVGVGAGYEIFHTTTSGMATVSMPRGADVGAAPVLVQTSQSDRGWEILALTLGFSYRISRDVGVGPFATATLGQYRTHATSRTATARDTVVDLTSAPTSNAGHALLMAGARGTWGL